MSIVHDDFSEFTFGEEYEKRKDMNEIIKEQIALAFSFKFLRAFFDFWNEIEDLSQNEKLKDMRNHYHKAFLSACWNTFFNFYAIFLILIIVMVTIKEHNSKFLVPFCVLICLFFINLLLQMKRELIEYVFIIILLIEALFMAYEGSFYKEYKFHEIWLIHYCTYLIISVSCCFHWKRMIVIFWFIQITYFIYLHFIYEKMSVYFYPGYIFITILLPLACMIIAKIVLSFLMLIHSNQELTKTIKKILQIFPEGILIQMLDENSGKLIVQFVNDTATKEIIDYKDPCGKPINDEKLNLEFKMSNNVSSNINNELNSITKLSSLLKSHVEKIQINEVEAISSFELCSGNCDEEGDECSKCKHYNVKTIQLKWGANKHSFIHVFVNTTAVKQIEVEKARNECLQLMFSSVSHEFRTPLNAFSNSALILESNYQLLLQKIEKFVPQELIPKLITQNQRESNEKFYTICKISTASLMSLVEDILDLAKLEAGTFSLNEQPFMVRNLLQDIENIFLFQCIQKGLYFKIDVKQETFLTMFCSDIGRIKQILMNLISNAFKFTLEGGIRLGVKLKNDFDILSFERVKFLEFTVSDTGIGISDNEIPNLFKMFCMANLHRNKYNCRGTGIGLTISKKLVESLGGSISLNSCVNVGTNVVFTVKFHKNSNDGIEESKFSNNNPSFSSDCNICSSNSQIYEVPFANSLKIFNTKRSNLSERNSS